jgi:hypothetical protein
MTKSKPRKPGERLLSPISTGFFLVLVGMIFIFTPNLFESILTFLRNLTLRPVPHLGFSLPAPESAAAHLTVYLAAERFALVWGLFRALMLVLTFAVHSSTRRKAEAFSSIIFWLGSALLIQILLIETTKWFEYWAAIIMLLGMSLIARAVFLAASDHLK